MEWETLLKRKNVGSRYFKILKRILIEMVQEFPKGTTFNLGDETFRDEYAQKVYDSGEIPRNQLQTWVKYKLEHWLIQMGARILKNVDFVEIKYTSGKNRYIIKAPITIPKKNLKLRTGRKSLPDEEEDDEPIPEESKEPDCLKYYKEITDVIHDMIDIIENTLDSNYEHGRLVMDEQRGGFRYSPSKRGYMKEMHDANIMYLPNDSTNYQTMDIFLKDFLFTKAENIKRDDACRLLYGLSGSVVKRYPNGIGGNFRHMTILELTTETFDYEVGGKYGEFHKFASVQIAAGFANPVSIRYTNYDDQAKIDLMFQTDNVGFRLEKRFQLIIEIAKEWRANGGRI